MDASEPIAADEFRAYLDLMAAEVGVDLPDTLTVTEAEWWRAELQRMTGRGATDPVPDEPLAARVDRAGVVDPQAMILPES